MPDLISIQQVTTFLFCSRRICTSPGLLDNLVKQAGMRYDDTVMDEGLDGV